MTFGGNRIFRADGGFVLESKKAPEVIRGLLCETVAWFGFHKPTWPQTGSQIDWMFSPTSPPLYLKEGSKHSPWSSVAMDYTVIPDFDPGSEQPFLKWLEPLWNSLWKALSLMTCVLWGNISLIKQVPSLVHFSGPSTISERHSYVSEKPLDLGIWYWQSPFLHYPHLYIQTRKATHCDPVHSIITRSADMTPRFIILGSIVIQTQRYQTRQPRIVIQICPMFYTYEHNQGLKSLFKKIGKCLDLKQKA